MNKISKHRKDLRRDCIVCCKEIVGFGKKKIIERNKNGSPIIADICDECAKKEHGKKVNKRVM